VDSSLVSVLGAMGAISAARAADLRKRCRNCGVGQTQECTCGDCPAEDLGVRLLLSEGEVSPDQVAEARAIQARLNHRRASVRIDALAELATRSRATTRRASSKLEQAARSVNRKSNPGLPAITDAMLAAARR